MSRAESLAKIRIFRSLSAEDLRKIDALVRERTVREGETIFEEKDGGDALYIVASGVIDIEKRGGGSRSARLARLRDGELIGELSLFDDGPRSATARAAVYPESTVYEIRKSDLLALLELDAPLAQKVLLAILRKVCERLREADHGLREVASLYLTGNVRAEG